MKKFVVILLALAMMISGSALAAPEDFAGVWVLAEQNSAGAVLEVFYLADDGMVYYTSASYFGYDSIGRRYIGLWEETEEGVHIIYGNTSEAYGKLAGCVLTMDGPSGKIDYFRVKKTLTPPAGIPPEKIASIEPTPQPGQTLDFNQVISTSGISIVLPSGNWVVGRDLPAGTYRVYSRSYASSIVFSYTRSGEDKIHTESVTDNYPSMFAYTLQEGDTVTILRGYAILRQEE